MRVVPIPEAEADQRGDLVAEQACHIRCSVFQRQPKLSHGSHGGDGNQRGEEGVFDHGRSLPADQGTSGAVSQAGNRGWQGHKPDRARPLLRN